jgi:hypothetical protein
METFRKLLADGRGGSVSLNEFAEIPHGDHQGGALRALDGQEETHCCAFGRTRIRDRPQGLTINGCQAASAPLDASDVSQNAEITLEL